MFKNKIPLILGSFVLGLATNYMFNDIMQKPEKEVSTKVLKSNKKSHYALLVKTGTLPEFIKNSLGKSELNMENLTEKEWNAFLEKIELQGLEKFVNSRNKGGLTLIHALSQRGAVDFVKELVKKGFDINAKTDRGETPLLLAIRSNTSLEKIKELIEMGADMHAITSGGRDLLNFAFQQEYIPEREKILQYLIEEQGFNFSDNPERYLEEIAGVPDGNPKYIMKALPHLEKKHYAKGIENIFMYGAGNDEIVDFFMENNANIGVKELNSITQGKEVSIEKLQSIIEKYNIDINEGDNSIGWNPLMIAVLLGDAEKVEFYLKQGADPTVTNKRGQNTFHVIAAETPRYPLAAKDEIHKIKNLLNKYAGRI